ncbi:MAG: glycosyltransferase family 2 protein [Rhodoferax sp.]
MTEISQPLVSIVVPFYNEGEAVGVFYSELTRVLDGLQGYRFEVVCVDDGSRDDTLERLKGLAQKDARVLVLELSRNFGKEAALTAGLDACTGDAAIPMDADLQDPPELIGALLQAWRQGYEVVLAKRTDRSSDSALKRWTAALFYRVHNQFSSVKIPENVGDFRLMDRVVLSALQQMPEQHRFMKGIFAWVGFRSTTVHYVRCARAAGQSKFNGWKLWNFALEGITSFSTAPLRFWTYAGVVGALSSLGYALYVMLKTLLLGPDVPGYPSLFVAVVFFGSVQMVGIGMLGEYIGRIYMESKRRPLYFVRKKYTRDVQ